MPLSDCLTPAGLGTTEKQIPKSYGGWTSFCQSYGLKPWDDDDAEEAEAILKGLAEQDELFEEDGSGGGSSNAASSTNANTKSK